MNSSYITDDLVKVSILLDYTKIINKMKLKTKLEPALFDF